MAGYGIDAYAEEKYGYGHGLLATLGAHSEDGQQVRVRWTYPPSKSWNRYRVTRSYAGQQVSITDGMTLYQNTIPGETEVIDTSATPGRRCYYSLWFFSTRSNVWVLSASADALCVKDWDSFGAMWDRLPQLYKTREFGVVTDNDDRTTQFARFMSLFTFSYDWLRTEYHELSYTSDPTRIAESLLPSLLRQYGFDYEPVLGGASARKLARYATKIHSERGQAVSIEDLATVLSGWYARAGVGHNLLLDVNDTLTSKSVGRWTQTVNASVKVGTVEPLFGTGYLRLISGNAGKCSVTFAAPTTKRALLTTVSIIAARRYTGTIYAQGYGRAQLWIDWYNAQGRLVSTDRGEASQLKNPGWIRMRVGSKLAPPSATRAALRVTVGSTKLGSEVQLNAAQLELAATEEPKAWQTARQPLLYLFADTVNHVKNPSGTEGTDYWNYSVYPIYHGDDTPPISVNATGESLLNGNGGLTAQERIYQDSLLSSVGTLLPTPIGEPTDFRPDTTWAGNQWAGTFASAVPVNFRGTGAVVGLQISYAADVLLDANGDLSAAAVAQFGQPGLVSSSEGFRLTLDSASVDPVPVVAGDNWVLQLEYRSRTETPIELKLVHKNAAGAILTTTSMTYQAQTDWRVIRATYRIPDTTADGSTLTAYVTVLGQDVEFRRVLLTETVEDEPEYFDGGSPSPTGDYLWEGAINGSRSHYYSRRTFKARRIKELTKRFIPMGYSAELLFCTAFPEQEANFDFEPVAVQVLDVVAELELDWLRVISWDDIRASYTTFNQIVTKVADYDALQARRVKSWDELKASYSTYANLTAYGEPWLVITQGY